MKMQLSTIPMTTWMIVLQGGITRTGDWGFCVFNIGWVLSTGTGNKRIWCSVQPIIHPDRCWIYKHLFYGRGEGKGGNCQIAHAYCKIASYANTLYTAFVLCTSPTLEHPDDEEGKNTDDHSEFVPLLMDLTVSRFRLCTRASRLVESHWMLALLFVGSHFMLALLLIGSQWKLGLIVNWALNCWASLLFWSYLVKTLVLAGSHSNLGLILTRGGPWRFTTLLWFWPQFS